LIEWLGFLYMLGKDVVNYAKDSSQLKEDEKLVDSNWPEKSGLTERANKTGLEFRWSAPDKVESRKFDGWGEMYSIDKKNKIQYKLVQKNGSVLIGRQRPHQKP